MRNLYITLLVGMFCHSNTSAIFAILPPALTEDFFVSDYINDRVAVYSDSGAYLSEFSAEGLDGPRGIVFDPGGSVYVASQNTDEILIFDTEGELQGRFTHGDVDMPTGMAMHEGELFVSSFGTDQIVVFDKDGNYQRSFTGGGMNGPNCIAFDSEGNAYVASAITAHVIKFDVDEGFVTSFTGGNLSSPMGIARDENDVLYVAGGGSSNIVKFSTDGEFLGQIRHPDLTGPQGVAFDDRGHIWSSSFFQHQLVEFDANGDYVQTITEGDLDIPRSIAFVPTLVELLTGDFDGSGVLDAADIDLLSTAALTGQFNAAFDLTGDGQLDEVDRAMWIEDLAGTRPGDADLNQLIEFTDFLALSRGFGTSGGWGAGDFDGSGEVDFPDFLELSRNFGATESAAATVPEPANSSFAWLLLVVALANVRRRIR